MSVLTVTDLSVSYGMVKAVDSVSISLAEGELVGLIGPNGAGKTSFIDAVSGFAKCAGSIGLDGTALRGLPPHARSRLGLARTFQTVELFEGMTVHENIALAARRGAWFKRHAGASDKEVGTLLAQLDLAEMVATDVDALSPGQRKLVMVARSLALKPRAVLLDEPAAGLDSEESRHLGRFLKKVAAAGIAVLLVEHDIDMVFEICGRIEVLNFGRHVASGTPSEIAGNPEVIAAYLGDTVVDRQLDEEVGGHD
jgi:ABC-type branched-subunit amino acid transport system ATPase component